MVHRGVAPEVEQHAQCQSEPALKTCCSQSSMCWSAKPATPPPFNLQLADILEALLADRAALAAVGRKALAKARSWTEHDNAGALVGYVQQALALAAAGRAGGA